jgi:hypothetical protein
VLLLPLQEMLDPTVGEGVVAAMKREVHRMELRHAELLRTQERLMQVGLDTLHCSRVCPAADCAIEATAQLCLCLRLCCTVRALQVPLAPDCEKQECRCGFRVGIHCCMASVICSA